MLFPRPESVRLIRGPRADAGRLPAHVADRRVLAGSQVLKHEPGAATVWKVGMPSGPPLVLKAVAVRRALQRLGARVPLLSRCVGGRGLRQWNGAMRLLRCGINTPRPRLLFRAAADGGELLECLVYDFAEGRTLLEVLRDWTDARGQPPRPQHALARRIGRLVGAHSAASIENRDLKPSNVLIAPDGEPMVLDPVGIRRHGGPPLRMLATLYIVALG
ncbi:MAG: hypothetical protein IBJ11_08760, partial [Phycisphaerales bacterium]|nr:hypothetical protein [Phycisphaerales bacterium]